MKKYGLLIVAMMLWGGYAIAGTDVLNVSASAAMSVSVNVSDDIAFGPYSGAQLADIGVINLTRSSNSLPVNITLSTGAAPDFTQRMLGADLEYNLYTDALWTIIWGDGSDTSVIVTWAAGGLNTASYTIYGRVPLGQSPAQGNFTDAITVTADY
ncbi:MAG: spore coat U domain-containing protein [bacterium]